MSTKEQFREVSNTVLDNIIVQQEIWMDNNPDSPRWFEWRTERNKAVAEWHRRRSVVRYGNICRNCGEYIEGLQCVNCGE